jgi:hypothetical protein
MTTVRVWFRIPLRLTMELRSCKQSVVLRVYTQCDNTGLRNDPCLLAPICLQDPLRDKISLTRRRTGQGLVQLRATGESPTAFPAIESTISSHSREESSASQLTEEFVFLPAI